MEFNEFSNYVQKPFTSFVPRNIYLRLFRKEGKLKLEELSQGTVFEHDKLEVISLFTEYLPNAQAIDVKVFLDNVEKDEKLLQSIRQQLMIYFLRL